MRVPETHRQYLNHCNHGNAHYLTRLVVFDRAVGVALCRREVSTFCWQSCWGQWQWLVVLTSLYRNGVCCTHCSGTFLQRVQICKCWCIVSSANATVQKVKDRCVIRICQFILMIWCCVCTVLYVITVDRQKVTNNFPLGANKASHRIDEQNTNWVNNFKLEYSSSTMKKTLWLSLEDLARLCNPSS